MNFVKWRIAIINFLIVGIFLSYLCTQISNWGNGGGGANFGFLVVLLLFSFALISFYIIKLIYFGFIKKENIDLYLFGLITIIIYLGLSWVLTPFLFNVLK